MRLNTLKGAAVGASVVYLLDPDLGRARRQRLAAQVGEGIRATFNAAVSGMESRVMSRNGRLSRMIGAFLTGRRPPGITVLRRARRRALNQWDIPMTTVNIDIDEGIVTLRGAFPSADESPVGATAPHRGFTRSAEHVHLITDDLESPRP